MTCRKCNGSGLVWPKEALVRDLRSGNTHRQAMKDAQGELCPVCFPVVGLDNEADNKADNGDLEDAPKAPGTTIQKGC